MASSIKEEFAEIVFRDVEFTPSSISVNSNIFRNYTQLFREWSSHKSY